MRDVPDFPVKGILFKDITPILQDGKLFRMAVDSIADRHKGKKIDAVVGIDALAAGGEALARVVRRPPLLPRGQLYFFLWNARPQSAKAQRELGWEPTPLEDGLAPTVAALA